jgi:hypothetical protein
MNGTLTYTGVLAIEECYSCHIRFAMPEDFQRRCREAGPKMTFHCPLGHAQCYSVSDAQRLREQLDGWRRRAERAETLAVAANDQATAAERSKRAYKGHLTRERKRIGNGVCPCCSRHFTNVERHMRGQHPGYAASEL